MSPSRLEPRRSAALLSALLLPLLLPAHAAGQTPELRQGRTVQGTLSEGDTARYAIEVGADHFLFGEVEQRSVDVSVRLLGPDGAMVLRTDGLGRGGERFDRELEEPGTYTLQVVAEDDQAGDYAVTIHRLEPVAEDPERLADQLMARWDGPVPGAAVRVWRDGRTLFSKAYGLADLTWQLPFETDTRTNIGSTSKQFTAFAVMLQAERGHLSLDDDVREHVPELPAFDDTVRVRHLLTHTSGLREFLNLLVMTGRRLDRGDWIDREELIEIVRRQPALQNEPGAEWNYNNTAFGLAALIVERTSGRPFHEFMREEVFEPLGMTRTMVRPSPLHIVPGRSEGYTPGPDGYLEVGDLGGAVGAGGIYTTVEDLQTWVENYANPRLGTRAMIDEMMTSYVLPDGEETGYGYGLGVGEQGGLKRVQHGGADVAHRSMLVYYPEIGAGLTVQSNNAQFGSGVAFRLAEAFFAEIESEEGEKPVAGAFDPADFDPEDFDDFAGRYALDASPAFVITFSRDGDRYFAQATGQPRLELTPTSDSTFAVHAIDGSVTFHRSEDGRVEGLTLHQNGDQHATRLADDQEAAWEPTAEELADYAGRYFSRELETFYALEVVDGELVLHHRRLDDAVLDPGARDEFSGANLSFAFERDRNGQVIGLYVANGRTRDVRFERLP